MQIIKDPSLEPYYIGRDSHCYTVYEVITPDSDRLRSEGSKGEDYEKPVAHYSKFGSALNKVAECQLHNSKENFDSVSKYLDRWDELSLKLEKLINYKGL
jgi:hypothetical protein